MFEQIKAIMCDLDGTLLTSEGTVSPRTVKAIEKAREKGLLFGLSTGRDVHGVKTLLAAWGIDGLMDVIVGTGGAEICDYRLGTESSSHPLDGELIKEIVRHFEDMPVNFAVPYLGTLYAPKDDENIRHLAKSDRVPYAVADFDEFLSTPKPKVMVVCPPELMGDVVERGKTFHSDKYKSASLITASVLYEYMDPRVSKTNGIKQAMEPHGLGLENICSFGDADNDYDMTLNCGCGVVMANGSEKTKSAADYVTADNNSDGIALFLEEHLL